MEGDLAGLNFSVFLVNFISDEDDGDVIADTGEILVPLGDVLVGDSSGDIEHDDGGLSTNVVTFSKSTEFLLSGGVPQGKLDWSMVGVEDD